MMALTQGSPARRANPGLDSGTPLGFVFGPVPADRKLTTKSIKGTYIHIFGFFVVDRFGPTIG